MTIRKTIQWIFVILLLAAAGGGGLAYWIWTRSDELLRQQVLAKIAEIAPHWDVDVGRARFDWVRKIHLYDVSLKPKDSAEPILQLQEAVVTFDQGELSANQNVVVQRIQLVQPTVNLVRDAANQWNWQKLLPLPDSQGFTPEWEIEQLQAAIRFEQPDGLPPTDIGIDDASVNLVPAGKSQYQVKAGIHVNELGKIQLDGNVDIAERSWLMNGEVKDIAIRRELLAVAEGISEKVRQERLRAQAALDRAALHQTAEAGSIDTGRATDVAATNDSLSVSGAFDVHFRVGCWKPGAELDYTVLVDLRQANLNHALLPFPLQDVRGQFFCDNRHVIVKELSARNAGTQVLLERAEWKRTAVAEPLSLSFDIRGLNLDARLQERLPAEWRKIFDLIQPTGQVDVEATLFGDNQGKWRPQGLQVTAKNCSIAYVKFPYRVTEITGTLKQSGEPGQHVGLDLDFLGRAGRRPVTARGAIMNPGPELQLNLDVYVEGLVVDDGFVMSCPLGVQKTLDELKLKGTADVLCRLKRSPGPHQKIQWEVAGKVLDGTLEYVHFPYRLSNLTGGIEFRSWVGVWQFEKARAVHGPARVQTTRGEFRMPDSANGTGLDLELTVENLELDTDLEQALPPRILKVWKDVAPRGRVTSGEVTVKWTPGHPPEIALPDVQVADGSLLLKAFPYTFDGLKAKAKYGRHPVDADKDLIEISELSAQHDDTRIRSKGFVEFARQDGPAAEWRVKLEDLHVDDLVPDRPFRRALPADLRSVIDVINPQGKLSLSGMMDFRGTMRGIDPVTSGWDLTTVLSQATLNTGVELTNVNGAVRSGGTWDGSQAAMRGSIALDSVDVWGHQLTEVRGPFELRDRDLIVGSQAMFPQNPRQPLPNKIPPSDHVTAKAFDAIITLDASASLREKTDYRVKVAMRDGNLRKYAQRYMAGTTNLGGTMDGWIDLQGSGPDPADIAGKGQLQIREAALYELPVIVQVFKALSFVPPDRKAFNYALTTFTVAHSQFAFDEIDMVGDAISLRGRGTAKFDGKLSLDFYSTPPKRQFNIPILKEVVFDPLTKGWVGVEVRGSVQEPRATITAIPQLDAALKQFLGAFNPRKGSQAPQLIIPWFGPPRAAAAPQIRPQTARAPR